MKTLRVQVEVSGYDLWSIPISKLHKEVKRRLARELAERLVEEIEFTETTADTGSILPMKIVMAEIHLMEPLDSGGGGFYYKT